MHFYQLYGLIFQSTFSIPDLPELLPTDQKPDATIQLVKDGCIHDFIPLGVAQQPIAIQIDPTDALVYLRGIGVFIVQGGCKIVLVCTQGAEQESICQALLGVVLAVLLHQRGLYILHASAVATHNIAIAFLGDSGAGKSSALAASVDQGWIGITDDLTAVHVNTDNVSLYSGVPKMKLSAAAATQLQLVSSMSTAEESAFAFLTANSSKAYNLQNLYILEYGADWSIETVPQQQAIIELLRFSGLKSVLPVRDRRHFKQAAQLVKHVNLYRLRRPRDLNQLSKLAEFLKDHIKSTYSGKYSLRCEVVK
ncbi:phosphoenolpyruvate carboxykinase (ATP) [Acaryochloris marina]|uniref:HPr kinase/phosphorylase C-terminal domain-containing protein n=1 Tax=Acaryochloris marina (strain MBIC 11017) TaxID=329726 RepID=B0C305_ACAM1|nr:hypothetical protein [Acaryochloris marina]ABW26221.1 hypothetical protein AM1_1184 [Acaryochloris marina MBIC11017]BDM81051.1 hypothetical protein AM10699_39180 [Acaryochloris marina MBIC10699]